MPMLDSSWPKDCPLNKPPDVEIKEVFKIGIKDHVRGKLCLGFHNQPTDLMNFIELCDKIDENHYHYQRGRSGFQNPYPSSPVLPSDARFDFHLPPGRPESHQSGSQWCKDNKSMLFKCGSPGHRKKV